MWQQFFLGRTNDDPPKEGSFAELEEKEAFAFFSCETS